MDITSKKKTFNGVIEDLGFGKYQIQYYFLYGFLEMADGMELLLLAMLSPILRCHWQISVTEAALMTTAAFLGMILGSPIVSNLADRYGRRPALIGGVYMSVFFGSLSAVAPTIHWIYLARFGLGFSVGATLVTASAHMSEIVPKSWRARSQAILFFAWTGGALFLVSIASFSINLLGWRIFLALTCIPSWIGLAVLYFTDESPRFLAVDGQSAKAYEILEKMAARNGRVLPPMDKIEDFDTLVANEAKGRIADLFRKDVIVLTLGVCFVWFVGGFSYYGAVLIASELPHLTYPCLQDSTQYFVGGSGKDTSCCQHLDAAFFITQAVSICGEFLGNLILMFIPDFIGRVPTMYCCAVLSAICFFTLSLCMSVALRAALLFVLRCFTCTFLNIFYVYIPEVYPTSIRTTAIGFANVFSRIGGLVTPFVSQVLLEQNLVASLTIYSSFCIMSALVAVFVLKETKGANLLEKMDCDNEKETFATSKLLNNPPDYDSINKT